MTAPVGGDDPSVRYVVAALVAGVFLGGVGGGVAFPTIPSLGSILSISSLAVGVILAVNRFVRLLVNTPAGKILDTVGTRRPMIAGLVVQGLVPFGYVLGLDPSRVWLFAADGPLPLSGAAVFFLSRALWGVGSAFVFVGAFSTITHITTTGNRGKWVGYMRGGQSLGFPAGLVLGGLLTDAYGYATAFVVAGVAGLFAAVVAFLVLPDVSPEVETGARLRDLPRFVARDRRILTVGTVNFVVRFLFAGVLLSTIVLYADANAISLGSLSGVGASGLVMAVSVLFSSVTTLVVGRYSDSLSNRAALTVPALSVFGTGFLVLALLPDLATTILGVALVGVGVGATNPPLLAYLGDISPADDVGKLGGVYNVFGDLGSTVGPLVALPVATRVGFTVEYLGCVAVVALAAVLAGATLYGDPPSQTGPGTPTESDGAAGADDD